MKCPSSRAPVCRNRERASWLVIGVENDRVLDPERAEILRPMLVANRRMAGWTRGFLGRMALPPGVHYLEAEGHRLRISQSLQSGDRAPQRRRPCQMSQ